MVFEGVLEQIREGANYFLIGPVSKLYLTPSKSIDCDDNDTPTSSKINRELFEVEMELLEIIENIHRVVDGIKVEIIDLPSLDIKTFTLPERITLDRPFLSDSVEEEYLRELASELRDNINEKTLSIVYGTEESKKPEDDEDFNLSFDNDNESLELKVPIASNTPLPGPLKAINTENITSRSEEISLLEHNNNNNDDDDMNFDDLEIQEENDDETGVLKLAVSKPKPNSTNLNAIDDIIIDSTDDLSSLAENPVAIEDDSFEYDLELSDAKILSAPSAIKTLGSSPSTNSALPSTASKMTFDEKNRRWINLEDNNDDPFAEIGGLDSDPLAPNSTMSNNPSSEVSSIIMKVGKTRPYSTSSRFGTLQNSFTAADYFLPIDKLEKSQTAHNLFISQFIIIIIPDVTYETTATTISGKGQLEGNDDKATLRRTFKKSPHPLLLSSFLQ